MRRKTASFMLGIILLLLLLVYSTLTDSFNSARSNGNVHSEDKFNQKYTVSSNELYYLYYLLKTQNLIEKKELYRDQVKLIDPSNLLKKENQGLLYDIWLYVNLMDEYGLSVSEQNKEKIISLLSLLQNDNGMFNAFYSEDTYDDNEYNYLFPTKLAIDVYEIFNLKTPNITKRQQWIDENIDEIIKAKGKDFISSGGFLYLSKYIKNKEEFNEDSPLIDYVNLVSDSYQTTPNSVEKFDTALNINNVFSSDIFPLNKNEIVNYLENVQLESGAFSLYGKKKYPDAMTTFLSVRLLCHFNNVIPKVDDLTVWLKSEIDATFGINE